MKLLIVGSRVIKDFDLSEHVGEDVDLIISRGLDGIDAIAEEYADKSGLSKLILRPNYKRYGKAASVLRDKHAVDICDSILVIWNGRSQEANHVIRYANKYNKPILILLYR